MFKSVLVVCVGNICRSPLGERLLRKSLPDLDISSAGINALVGYPADETTSRVASRHGISLAGHHARQFTRELGSAHDLILAMEPGHQREILRIAPYLAGRIMLFDQWTGAKGIPDPYQQSEDFQEKTYWLIEAASEAWKSRLSPTGAKNLRS